MQINNEILNDFIICHYKAYRKSKHQTGIITDYQLLYNQLRQKGKENFERTITKNTNPIAYNPNCYNNTPERGISLNPKFTNSNIDISLDGIEFKGKKNITPIFITPFEKVTATDKLFVSLQALLIETEFNLKIVNCKVIHGKNLQGMQFKLSSTTKNIKKIIVELNKILLSSDEPTLILNRHCAYCEFSSSCKEKANTDGNMSLLDRATPKVIEKYKKKGIFTIQQLSYLYKPRRRKKRVNPLVVHNLELQAFALRTDKIYAQQLPELSRQPIELFLDIEGNPDQELYYLIGVLTCNDKSTIFNSFWADTTSDKARIWQQFLSIINKYPDGPIYHYGNYELKAIETLGRRYNSNVTQIQGRLINIVNSIYGKIYFPVYSNRLKELGTYVGAKWSSINSSGIQSLVWRYQWNDTQDEKFKQILITYNLEDCQALKLLTDKLSQLQESANVMPEIDFVNEPKKESNVISFQVHQQFGTILKFAHENYNNNKLSFQKIGQQESNKIGAKVGHKGTTRTIPKARRIIDVPIKRICPIHKFKLVKTLRTSEQTLTDIVFTKHTMRKTIIKYVGYKSFCSLCNKYFMPPKIEIIKGKYFGHNFKSWIVYQRLVLRLPFNIIQLNLKELFSEYISQGTLTNTIRDFSSFYNYTEKQNLKQILNSRFIHADETKVNVKGIDHYVWILTNGKQTIFRETDTREIDMILGLLKEYLYQISIQVMNH